MPAHDVYRVRLDSAVGFAVTAEIFYFEQLDADGTENPAVSLFNCIQSQILPAMVAERSTGSQIYNAHIQKVLPLPAQGVDLSGGTIPGTIASDALPTGLTVVTTFYTLTTTKKGRSRNHWVGLPESSTTDNELITARKVAINLSLANIFVSNIDPGSLIHWIGRMYSTTDNVIRNVTRITTRARLTTIKSRAVRN